ncbi:TonB-linked SusC/RagA family outer membrane protein [Maribacter vaceletii]|uniref:TonB-linked SusC/RagA family outer membrane protein n=1 Tax=Maribacter vaceletii TaxID=1206816 RepID=A0A495E969_9FLAO|nr:TonB-dependent receptor [Maribacter vaceletii]RKR13472.1 TonB-linked SusC/RagA family outer membrane protein [Maribacter vaceletii]
MKFSLKRNLHFETKQWLLVFVCIFSFITLQAQQKNVKGTVSDNSGPLPGVSIFVKGTSNGVVSDFDGNYSINANDSDILVFSYIGFSSKEINVKNQTVINVSLVEDVSQLEEVVVIGYGTQKKKEVTGAVVSVKNEELAKTTTSDIGAALQGQIAGVNITSASGAPGEEANILIRGFSSLIDGQNGPLYVVDGIPFDSDPQLSISEIESIDVLKDAASASIYGTRGAGGVILITTKKGKVGQMSIRLNSEYGIQKITSDFDAMTSEEYSYLHLLRGALNTDKPQGGVDGDIHRNASYFTNNTNIGDVLLNDNAPIQNHSVNVSGGRDGLTYSFNGNFFEQEGGFYSSNAKRFNIRSNTEFIKGKWKISTGITAKRDERLVPFSGMINRIYQYRPFQPEISLDTDAIANISQVSLDDPTNDWQLNEARRLANAVRTIKTDDQRNSNSYTGNIQFDYSMLKNLTLTARFGATYTDQKWEKIIPRFDIFNTEGELISNPDNITSNQLTDITSSKITSEQFLNYKNSFGKHNISLLAGTSFEKSKNERYQLEVRNNLHPSVTVVDNYELIWDVESGGFDFERTLIGNIGRIQYNYDGKYILSASGRYDGSSQFSDGQKWGFFPSVSIGWNISDEKFWEPLKEVVNTFRMRAGYGTTGNDRFAAYSNQTVVETGRDYAFGSNSPSGDLNNPSSEGVALGTTQLEFGNPNLKWETNVERNIGWDFAFFKNKLTFSTDYYTNEKQDLLYQVVNPPSTGVSGEFRNTIFNIGNMENTGVEYAFKYNHRSKKGLSWNVSGTYTNNTNRVTKTSVSNPIIYLDRGFISNAGTEELVTVITEGYEAASFFLRETAGVIKTEEQLEEYREIDPSAKIGELMYVDQLTEDTDNDGIADAGNGRIDDNDKVYAGSGTPDFEAGLNFSANYKGVDFSMQWYGSFGAEVLNGSKAYAYQVGTHKDLFYSWTQNNTNSDIPWYDGNNSRSYRGGSDYFLENGDFIRLRNISLGYSFPKKWLEGIGFSKFRVYVQAQNPLTITDYSGFDPEAGGNGLSTRGIDQGKYPISSQYKAGLQIQF